MDIEVGQSLWYKPLFSDEWEKVTVEANAGAYGVEVIREGGDCPFLVGLHRLSTTPSWEGGVNG